jgi:hypothetical protein
MSVDETNTVDALTMTRRIAREELDLHGGWLFGLPGDGIFALFESAVDAVKCALEIQQRLLAMSRLSTMRLRIGVHLGEVVFQDGLPYGEALVIAARLESHAEPGGVLVSAAVMDAVAPRIAAQFYERGVFNLKHSPRRITTYSVSVDASSRDLDLSSGTGEALDRTILSVPSAFGSEETPAPQRAVPVALVGRQEPVADPGGPSEGSQPVLPPARLDPVPEIVSVEPDEAVRTTVRPVPETETILLSERYEPARPPADFDPVPDPLAEPAGPISVPVAQIPVPDTVSLLEPAGPVPAPDIRSPTPDTIPLAGSAGPAAVPVAQDSVPDVSFAEQAGPAVVPFAQDAVPDVSLPKATPLIVRSLTPEAELGQGELPPVRAFTSTAAEVVLSPDCAEEFIQALTQHIGPVAGVLVRRLASRYADPLEFIDALADEIPAEEERLQFKAKARQVIRRQHS